MSGGYRVAVVGATGVVGATHAARFLRERKFPAARSSRSRPGAPPAGRSTAGRYGRSTTTRHRRLRHRAVLGRAGVSREWAPQFVDGGRHRDRQLLGVSPRPGDPAGRLRGQPACARRPSRADRQPQLLDHAAGGRARADPPQGRDRAAGRRHLPVGVGHRKKAIDELDAQAAPRCAGARSCRRRRCIRSRSRST